MKMIFASPDSVSKGDQKDKLEIEVKELSLFKTVDGGESLVMNGPGVISKSCPPIIDPETKETMK